MRNGRVDARNEIHTDSLTTYTMKFWCKLFFFNAFFLNGDESNTV